MQNRVITLLILKVFICSWIYCQEATLEEKVGQMLIVQFHGQEANDEAKLLIEKGHVGGFIYYNWANGLESPQQVKQLSLSLQKMAKIPLFISVDQEGGRVCRLVNGFTPLLSAEEMGKINDLAYTRSCALQSGKELQAVGINMNFAPVADIATSSGSTINTRSYGSSPQLVANHVVQAILGYKEAGILTVVKHFPGLGSVTTDPHFGLPTLKQSYIQLKNREFIPFIAAINAHVPAVMTAHVLVPFLDQSHCATLSKTILSILREKLGFKGVIVSDSLIMKGATGQFTYIEKTAISAINAGCDLLILGGRLLNGSQTDELSAADLLKIHQAIVDAVKRGNIPEKRINESYERIVSLKNITNTFRLPDSP